MADSSFEISLRAIPGGESSAVTLAVADTSYQSGVMNATAVVVTPTVTCFFRTGSNPTALSDGTDQILVGGASYRITITYGTRFAFRTATGTGTVYLSPGA